jgi:chromosome segregation ATPase
MRGQALLLGVVVLSLCGGCGEDPVPKLQHEKQALLDATVPREEFWSEVERKGALLKEQRAADAERAETNTRADAVRAETEPVATALAQARQVNAQTEAALAQDREELARLEREVAARQATLDGFAARGSTGAAEGGTP